jgi:hypothetical protein
VQVLRMSTTECEAALAAGGMLTPHATVCFMALAWLRREGLLPAA